ncbi:DUF2092 domain-containing protein [bacterium]|nr:DUF2092 domain-containing protein [bacterium]
MNRKYVALAIGLLLLVFTAGVIRSQETPRAPSIDPEADQILRQMSDQLKQVKSRVFRLADTIDDVQPDGRKIQFAHVREMTVVKPDKLKVETFGDITNRILWKDGKTLTVFDKDKKVYAQLHDPGTIDQAIDMLQDQYNMSLPAADLLTEDVYHALVDGCNQVNYVGMGFVGEEKCHHLAFSRDNIDYQLWISAGEKLGPRKLVITYKLLPGEPQYTLQLLSIKDSSKITDAVFTCDLPKDAVQIEFQPPATPR